jgi:hypothetical protein
VAARWRLNSSRNIHVSSPTLSSTGPRHGQQARRTSINTAYSRSNTYDNLGRTSQVQVNVYVTSAGRARCALWPDHPEN